MEERGELGLTVLLDTWKSIVVMSKGTNLANPGGPVLLFTGLRQVNFFLPLAGIAVVGFCMELAPMN